MTVFPSVSVASNIHTISLIAVVFVFCAPLGVIALPADAVQSWMPSNGTTGSALSDLEIITLKTRTSIPLAGVVNFQHVALRRCICVEVMSGCMRICGTTFDESRTWFCVVRYQQLVRHNG